MTTHPNNSGAARYHVTSCLPLSLVKGGREFTSATRRGIFIDSPTLVIKECISSVSLSLDSFPKGKPLKGSQTLALQGEALQSGVENFLTSRP